ncbi:MAG: hypothetical protein K8S54_17975 [Spirochaetia bacterium]|nr:hypothetical protein [Spirochaetia bacterium]
MFIGHYSASFALKRLDSRVPIFLLMIGVQFMDFLFMVFILFGVERMEIVPGFTEVNAFVLSYMPYSHSLVAALFWSVVYGAACAFLIKKLGFVRALLICGAAVFSHYILDVLVHTPDMPILSGTGMKLGLGIWKNRIATIIVEGAFLSLAWFAYIRMSQPGPGAVGKYGASVFFGFLVALTVATPFMPVPKTIFELSAQALAGYVIIALLARWIDSKRIYVA